MIYFGINRWADGIWYELGDGAVADAVVYHAFVVAARHGRRDVSPARVLACFYHEWKRGKRADVV